MLHHSTLKEDWALPSVLHPISLAAKTLYGVVLRLLFTAIAVVTLLVGAIVAAVLLPKVRSTSFGQATPRELGHQTKEEQED
ncbi:MAG: hypothetical protein F6K47_17695 [Symploca sp. SIO2E6]|nr:hypothetical protein [Symploca sp. SIO2E6]